MAVMLTLWCSTSQQVPYQVLISLLLFHTLSNGPEYRYAKTLEGPKNPLLKESLEKENFLN